MKVQVAGIILGMQQTTMYLYLTMYGASSRKCATDSGAKFVAVFAQSIIMALLYILFYYKTLVETPLKSLRFREQCCHKLRLWSILCGSGLMSFNDLPLDPAHLL